MPLPPPLHDHPTTPEDELRRSRERLLLALEAGHMGTWDWDVEANRVAWSPTLERLHGMEPGTFPGTFEAFLEDILPEDRERVLARIDEALAECTDYRVEYRIVRPDGAERWLESRGKLFCHDDGRPALMAGVCSDVTERKRGEDALRMFTLQTVDNARIRSDLERALAARDRVLAVVSHDLREPLNSVALALQLIEESGCVGEPPIARAVASARRGLDRGEHLIRELLDASRLDSGRIHLDRTAIDPLDLLREATEPFTIEARESGIDLQLDAGHDLPMLCGDRNRLTQVLSNLLRNAFEVTGRGGTVRVSADAVDGAVRFRVADSGPGIPPDDLPNLFDAFWQGDGPGRGTAGLGLAIARGLVEAHDGKITAANAPEGGAVFTFTVPTGD